MEHYEGCVRAFNALGAAYLSVASRLGDALEQGAGISISEFEVLVSLDAHDRLPLFELEKISRLSQSALSRLVSRMERRGLVSRYPDRNDRRSIAIGLTGEGKTVIHSAVGIHAECIRASLLGRLTFEERMALKEILAKITDDEEPDTSVPTQLTVR